MSTEKKIEVDETELSYVDDSTIGEYETEEEEFEDLFTIGMKVEQFADKEIGARYAKWVSENQEMLTERYGDPTAE